MARSRIPVRSIVALLIVFVALACTHPARAAALDADSLYRLALEHMTRGTREYRRLALDELEQAKRTAGNRADVLNAVARTYSAMGYLARARDCLDRIADLTADDADAQIELGLLWKWEWLASLELSSYQKAIRCLLRAAQHAPRRAEPRIAITALALAKGDTSLAMRAAQGAVFANGDALESALALGCAAYRAGRLAVADSAFRSVIPDLPDEMRARFTGLSGAAWDRSARRILADSAAASAWIDSDPDLTTRENEVQLDFWARVAHAILLFESPDGLRWDIRAELLARYGVTPKVELPPPPGIDEDMLTWNSFRNAYAREAVYYPYHKQTWIYPELGIRADIWDRALSESYALPVAEHHDADPRPNPALLASRPDLVMLENGRGVYRTMAPGVTPIPARGAIARFPSEHGARLVAHIETSAEPSAPLEGTWAVVAADGHEAARGSGPLSLSACAPGERRIVQLEAEVPPGDYRVHLAVSGGGRRGVVRLRAVVEAAPPGLAMSDLVLLCGAPVAAGQGGPLIIEPDFAARRGAERTVSVYFEARGLSVDAGGRSRFSYRYAVRAVDENTPNAARRPPQVEATREEDNVGGFRRQVVSAPIATIPAGTYEFEVELRDLVSGALATRAIRFVKT